MPNSLRPHGLYSPWNSPGQNAGVGSLSLLPNPGIKLGSPRGDLPNPGIEPRSHALQADFLPAEPQVKHENTEVGSLSLLPNPGIKLGSPALQADSLPPGL